MKRKSSPTFSCTLAHANEFSSFLILMCLLITCPHGNSNFNVILPELCDAPGFINLTWIRSMVALGIRDEKSANYVNIFKAEEICDGSKGLFKFISLSHAHPQSHIIASLHPDLCTTATNFISKDPGPNFVSWTCPAALDSVISLKPTISEELLAVKRMLRYLQWKSVALAKSQYDDGSFCDKLANALHTDTTSNTNYSALLLGPYEKLGEYESLLLEKHIDGIMLCVSYQGGISTTNSRLSKFQRNIPTHDSIPTILVPEWPLPETLFKPQNPTLALVGSDRYRHPYHSEMSSSSFEFSAKSWHSYDEDIEAKELRYEKSRWHPLINLVEGGGNHFMSKEKLEESPENTYNSELRSKQRSFGTWVQILLVAVIATGLIVGLLVIIAFSICKRKNPTVSSSFSSLKSFRRLSRRYKNHGNDDFIITAKDISIGFSMADKDVKETMKKPNKSPFIPGFVNFHRNSQDKAVENYKGNPFAITLKKQASVPHFKNDNCQNIHAILGENVARFKGNLAYVKKLTENPIQGKIELKTKTLIALEAIHGLRHQNLASMLGFYAEKGPALVMEYCCRGSLHDVLSQQHLKLDWSFKLSLLTDLVRGMRYLHSTMLRAHGHLTSYNCVIDARWVLKITDYGIPAINFTQGFPQRQKTPKELLWTAPELLRDEVLQKQGTQPGDVYSFAIIVQETLVRGEPYCMFNLTAEEILEKVKKPPPLIRPSVSKGAAPPEAINIMRQCWAELPDMRPDFTVIHDLFKTLNHGRKGNIVDTMFQMLEKYSNNLEELIRERTEQLDLEKKKTEQLLNRMLPNTVAEKLKVGQPVDPEEFSEVTIYFSDIVGFTTISAYSTPFEVVDLLNDLYTCFDATINDYNVYKVETIGDAYMVVGGAPLWSPDHADQVATMALDLLHQSGKFRIRHLPFTSLRLRIGLHTGSCCAGVVGLTMPRYCLFGDTVNTASRMESTGAAWRIHISLATKKKLDEAGKYFTEYRGETDIKGRGRMHTYWLLGKEGFDKELPTPPNLELDENTIQYGRTGLKVKQQESENSLQVCNENASEVRGESTKERVGGAATSSQESSNFTHFNVSVTSSYPLVHSAMSNSKILSSQPNFGFIAADSHRCLSPAEQVAHQLLNGKPTTKGLRRQLSLDQRPMTKPSDKVPKRRTSFTRAPSLEGSNELCGLQRY